MKRQSTPASAELSHFYARTQTSPSSVVFNQVASASGDVGIGYMNTTQAQPRFMMYDTQSFNQGPSVGHANFLQVYSSSCTVTNHVGFPLPLPMVGGGSSTAPAVAGAEHSSATGYYWNPLQDTSQVSSDINSSPFYAVPTNDNGHDTVNYNFNSNLNGNVKIGSLNTPTRPGTVNSTDASFHRVQGYGMSDGVISAPQNFDEARKIVFGGGPNNASIGTINPAGDVQHPKLVRNTNRVPPVRSSPPVRRITTRRYGPAKEKRIAVQTQRVRFPAGTVQTHPSGTNDHEMNNSFNEKTGRSPPVGKVLEPELKKENIVVHNHDEKNGKRSRTLNAKNAKRSRILNAEDTPDSDVEEMSTRLLCKRQRRHLRATQSSLARIRDFLQIQEEEVPVVHHLRFKSTDMPPGLEISIVLDRSDIEEDLREMLGMPRFTMEKNMKTAERKIGTGGDPKETQGRAGEGQVKAKQAGSKGLVEAHRNASQREFTNSAKELGQGEVPKTDKDRIFLDSGEDMVNEKAFHRESSSKTLPPKISIEEGEIVEHEMVPVRRLENPNNAQTPVVGEMVKKVDPVEDGELTESDHDYDNDGEHSSKRVPRLCGNFASHTVKEGWYICTGCFENVWGPNRADHERFCKGEKGI